VRFLCIGGTLAPRLLYGVAVPLERHTSVFAFYRDSPQRQAALSLPRGAPERYVLFGLDQLAEAGFRVGHNLDRGGEPPAWARVAGTALQTTVQRMGGYGGDFARVLPSLRRANRADVVFSTVDTVGIPLVALAALGVVRRPIVYVSIGLLPRLAGLEDRRIVAAYGRVLRKAAAVVAYGKGEAEELEAWLRGGRVVFIPFGVDTEHFRPSGGPPDVDVVSIGADPRRDFELLVGVAARNPAFSFRVVASGDHARTLGALPPNVQLEADIPFAGMRARLGAARVVALPVRENAYSGATTTLLQAMACGKPVVVSHTAAIAEGYELEDGQNVRLVPPGDSAAFEHALLDLLEDRQAAAAMGARARETAERHLSWRRYVDALRELLAEAARRAPPMTAPPPGPEGRAADHRLLSADGEGDCRGRDGAE
jgi:glycosyltransferase involved in cell wall biosynthesis